MLSVIVECVDCFGAQRDPADLPRRVEPLPQDCGRADQQQRGRKPDLVHVQDFCVAGTGEPRRRRRLAVLLRHTVRAEVFDDLLEHARYALGGGRRNEAAAVASVVFEDTVRRIADKYNIAQKGVKLDIVISSLTTAKVFSAIKAKRARAAADLRNQATHAQ